MILHHWAGMEQVRKKVHVSWNIFVQSIFSTCIYACTRTLAWYQGSLTERNGSVLLTSLNYPIQISFLCRSINQLFYKTSYLNEEVNCTEPFPSVSIPWWYILARAFSCLSTKEPPSTYIIWKNRQCKSWLVLNQIISTWYCVGGLVSLPNI